MRGVTFAIVVLVVSACVATRSPPDQRAQICALPGDVRQPPLEIVRQADIVRDTPIAYYMLAITWSPEWCRANGDKASERMQCIDNRFGWVLHGLWPNGAQAPHPRYCRPAAPVGVTVIRNNLCLTPSPELIQHAWAAHGVCGWSTPEAYFAEAASLWGDLSRPDPSMLAGSSRSMTVGHLRAAFVESNTNLISAAIFVGATPDNRLREIRICYDLSMKPSACPVDTRGLPDDATVLVESLPE